MFKKILVPVDYAEPAGSRRALTIAADMAAHHEAELIIISVIPEIIRLPNLPEDYGAGAKDHVSKVIRGFPG